MDTPQVITVEATVALPPEDAWKYWTTPAHIVFWNSAATTWHCPAAVNDLQPGGRFSYRMEARDASMGFDFCGTHALVEPHRKIESILDDGRKLTVSFLPEGGSTRIMESFEAESQNSPELQRTGWQAILDNYRAYAESRRKFVKAEFRVEISANADRVYRTLTGREGFGSWTAVFNPHSRYEGKWAKGEKVLFLGQDGNGKVAGMVSMIREDIPPHFTSILHLGQVIDGKEVMSGPGVDEWSGALEEYFLEEKDGRTALSVSMDTTEPFRGYFDSVWPEALGKLKELCERA